MRIHYLQRHNEFCSPPTTCSLALLIGVFCYFIVLFFSETMLVLFLILSTVILIVLLSYTSNPFLNVLNDNTFQILLINPIDLHFLSFPLLKWLNKNRIRSLKLDLIQNKIWDNFCNMPCYNVYKERVKTLCIQNWNFTPP